MEVTTAQAAFERQTFTVSPHIIYSLIKAQAGTLAKAVLECIMNSVDAGATSLQISVTSTGLEVIDDGKGFRSREEIEACFGVFGFEQKEGDRTYLANLRKGNLKIMSTQARHADWLEEAEDLVAAA